MAYRNYARNVGYLVDGGNGDFTTIQAAITAASTAGFTGDICINPGTYTENPILAAGINLVANTADAFAGGTTGTNGKVVIIGKCSFTGAGTVTLSGLTLRTNSDYAVSVTGSAASILNIIDCNIIASNNTAINLASSGGGAGIYCKYCEGYLNTNVAYFTVTNGNTLTFNFCNIPSNSTSNSTKATCSSGTLSMRYCSIGFLVSVTSAAALQFEYVAWDGPGTINASSITFNSSDPNSYLKYCTCSGGSAAAVTITSGTLQVIYTQLNSSNTNAITGAGTVNYAGLIFTGTGTGNNVSTKNLYTMT